MKNRTGEVFKNNKEDTLEIIEWFNSLNCTIKFLDGNSKN